MANWFEVDKDGLAGLQAGKPKHHIVRELVANAFDENIKECRVNTSFKNGVAIIAVDDDNPDGFKDLSDSYTLFKKSEKRLNPTQRGRFNVGEKQAIALSDKSVISTTKGTVIFDKDGRHHTKDHTKKGSEVTVHVKMTKEEYDEMIGMVKEYIVPQNIKFVVNGEIIRSRKPFKVVDAVLQTEIEKDGVFRRTMRKTQIHIMDVGVREKYLYEMGIPILSIDCDYGIDVQQKVPMSIDREAVSPAFLKAVYAEVLNATVDMITSETASNSWVRTGMSDERVKPDVVKDVVKRRYGTKVVIANPFDRNSIDEAISHGYNVVYGSENSKEEWDKIKEAEAMKTTTDLFGTKSGNDTKTVEPDKDMNMTGDYAKAIAKKVLGISIGVQYEKSPSANYIAKYGGGTLTFNVSRLDKDFFKHRVSVRTTDLIIHELAHHAGNHTEHSYHEMTTKMGATLTMIALKSPDFFEKFK